MNATQHLALLGFILKQTQHGFAWKLGCHSQELSKEAPFILKPKKECIIFLQKKASKQSCQSACKKEKQGGKKNNTHLRIKSLLGIPPSNRKQQTNNCKYLEETTPWTLSANSSLNLEESLSLYLSLSLPMIWWRRRWRRRSTCTQMLCAWSLRIVDLFKSSGESLSPRNPDVS